LMMPSGHGLLYGTGWLTTVPKHNLMAMYVPEAAAEYEWFSDRQLDPDDSSYTPAYTTIAPGGDAMIFRSGWLPDDTWLGLIGRTEPAASSHSQPDQMSLSLMSHGALLLLDPGDGRSYRSTDPAKENWLQSIEGHNNVVIYDDDLQEYVGPQFQWDFDVLLDPAEVVTTLIGDTNSFVKMEGSILEGLAQGGTDHDRRILFVENEFFLVHDHLVSGEDKKYRQQWHFGGPITSGDGTLTLPAAADEPILWETTNPDGEDVALTVQNVGGDPTYYEFAGPTNYKGGQTWDHTYVRVAVLADEYHYFTLLLPWLGIDSEPIATVLEDDDDLRLVEVDLNGEPIQLALNTTQGVVALDTLASDALLSASDDATWLFLAEGSILETDTGPAVWSSCHLDALNMEVGANLQGWLDREPLPCTLEVTWDTSPTLVIVDGVATDDWTWDEGLGTVTLDPAPLESFSIE
ncbi:MAG: hypothetical protein HN348_21905, partial [Proteobacteria bacterium]|nr:hypothetical protein [Pseudomonadota bacterium]